MHLFLDPEPLVYIRELLDHLFLLYTFMASFGYLLSFIFLL